MPSSPSLPRRLSQLGPTLGAAAVLLLPGCGDGSGATAERAGASQPRRQVRAAAIAGRPCPAQVDVLVKAMEALRHQLAAGLSYEQYAARLKALRRDYDEIPTERLGLGCVTATGTPAEAALNEYTDAANAWGECLADAACATATIEPVLQRKWRVASRLLGEAG